ncbi:hypothetical protein AJ79_08680 [Helicocarpus griseus UAMH5409]|uniref:C2H2-type domain-containing protein n=1 Tax=Helicocarpus griseus UAMH5409 TaxID=1447875 RepID=A0A2B7WRA1_9EURO|nr:hypothetical protein AJ79_08680 [Helicocarpus griseus UAMH5409]
MAQYETLNIPSCIRSTPEHHPFDLSGFNPNLGVLVSQEQQDWSSIPINTAVCSYASMLPFGAGVSNPEIGYSDFPLGQEHYSTVIGELSSNTFDYNMLSHSSAYAQQNYYYAGHAPGNVSATSQGYHGDFKNSISPRLGTMLSDGPICMPPPESHDYSLQPPQIPLARQERHRRSITPNIPDARGQASQPGSITDGFLQHRFFSHSALESYHGIPPGTPSLNRHTTSASSHHTYPTSSSLHNSLNSYQISRQCPFSPASDTGIPVSSPTAEGFASRYNVSPDLQDQVRVEISKLIRQCWDHGCNGREFSSFGNLVRHQRERAGTKSECPRCGKVFTRTTSRDRHLAKVKCKAKREQQQQ